MRSTLGKLPEYLIIGAAKSGTSTLFRYLRRHPDVFDTPEKEPCFFDAAVNWNRGLDWYRSLFAGAREDELCGEASTNYTRFPQVDGVPERIKRTIPGAKLVYLVRHPVDRAYSHYVHRYTKELHRGEPVRVPFEEFVERDPMCLDGSDYALQLERYLEHFAIDRILVLRQDALADSPGPVLDRAQRFLGLSPRDLVGPAAHVENDTGTELARRTRERLTGPVKRIPGVDRLRRALPDAWKQRAYDILHRSPLGTRIERELTPPPLRASTRARLLERYGPSIDRLEDITGEDFSSYRV